MLIWFVTCLAVCFIEYVGKYVAIVCFCCIILMLFSTFTIWFLESQTSDTNELIKGVNLVIPVRGCRDSDLSKATRLDTLIVDTEW